jgi:ATP-dependent DNA helicase DinG
MEWSVLDALPDASSPPVPFSAKEWLGDQGLFAQSHRDFRPRDAQLEMADRVGEAIRHRHILMAEAGTGTGKTFAYLVPALLTSVRTLVSTGSKTLQDQLFHRDLPHVQSVLRRPFTVALLKGRSNYLCHFRFQQTWDQAALLPPVMQERLLIIQSFIRTSPTGDRAGLAAIPDDDSIWPYVTSNRDNCLGNECPFKDQCFVIKARREALQAQLIVANHHLLLADFRLKDEGASELLPYCDTVIVDEAHHLPELASEFFGESASSGQWSEVCRDLLAHVLTEASDAMGLLEHTQKLQRYLEALDRHIDRLFPYVGRFPCSLERTPELLSHLEAFIEHVEPWMHYLEEAAPRTVVFAQLFKRASALEGTLKHWIEVFPNDASTVRPYVHWLERRPKQWRIVLTPLNAGERFHERLCPKQQEGQQSWILTSATLAVANDFSLYRESLGLGVSAKVLSSEIRNDEALLLESNLSPNEEQEAPANVGDPYVIETHCWESPFDYSRQALLYLPKGLPEPNQTDHTVQLMHAVWPLLCMSRGRALLLFTSFKAMEVAWETFHALCATHPESSEWLPLLQGHSSKADLLDQFSKHPHPVLLGSHSFWEGVDLPGRQLSLLVIDRIPFMPPDDPITSARLNWLKHQGRDPFRDYQLPKAILVLRQGVGRLIRTERDEGVVVIGDPRLRSKYYGRRILKALPSMSLTQDESVALAFLSNT